MASYSTIIANIDDAIASWVSEPVTLTISGRTITYRSLDELIRARKYYVQRSVNSSNSKPFKITELKTGSAR